MVISRRALRFSVACTLWLPLLAATVSVGVAARIYTYQDDSGTQNFTSEFDSIPEQYRSRVIPLDLDSAPPPPPSPPASSERSGPSANVRVVSASADYRMGDHDTRSDAVRMAVEAAKRDALEQVATYLERVTEVRNLDVTRDEIRSYTAGIVMVLDQKISTRLDGDTVVIHADLRAQVDPDEVAQAIAALRDNESARTELAALRAETDELHQQLEAANQALAAASSPEQVQSLSQQREDLLNQLQANALVSQAWTDWVYVTPVISPSPWIGVQQVRGLLRQAQHLYPRHRHLPILQQIVTTQAGALPPFSPGTPLPGPPSSLLVPPPAFPRPLPPPPPPLQTAPPGLPNVAPSAPAARAPGLPRQFALPPLPPTLQQIHPPHAAQPDPPVQRIPYVVPHHSPPESSQRSGGGGGGRSGGGGQSGGGGRGR